MNPILLALSDFYNNYQVEDDFLVPLRAAFKPLPLKEMSHWAEWYDENYEGWASTTTLEALLDDLEDSTDNEREKFIIDEFSKDYIDKYFNILLADIPVRLGDTGLYALFMYGTELIENISVTRRQLVRARGISEKLLTPPSIEEVEEEELLLKPYMREIEEIQNRSSKPSDYDRDAIIAAGGEWLLEAASKQRRMNKHEAYRILHSEMDSQIRALQIELYLAATLGSTMLFNADGSFNSQYVSPFSVVTVKGRQDYEIVRPIEPLRELIQPPTPDLSEKQKFVLEQLGVNISIERRLTYRVEQRILWGVNFSTTFPAFLTHLLASVAALSRFANEEDYERWLPDVLQEVDYPSLDDTFLYR